MSLREIWNMILRSYCLIVTGSLFCTGIFCALFWKDAALNVNIIWQVLGSSAAVSLLFFLYYSKKELSARSLLIRDILFFFCLLAILLGCAYLFEWVIFENIIQPLCFAALVALTYASIKFFIYQMEKREAAAISSALQDYNRQKKEK